VKAISSTPNQCNRAKHAALVLAFASAVSLVWSSGGRLHAQQPNRQLTQGPAQELDRAGDRRIALVIGNGAYTNAPPLKNPPNDARDMAATLKELGFEVASGVNLKQQEMKSLIRNFGQKLKAGGSGLFYYAGHGVQSNGRNYLIPVEADIQSEAEVEDLSVDLSLVLKYMDEAQNPLNIVILDACRNNPFARSFRSASNGLAQVDAPTGTLIAYATAPGRVASDGTGRNGLYTSELLKQMRVPSLNVTEMFMHVRAEVMKYTSNKQVPWEASSLVGTFYFRAPKSNAGTPTTGAENETKFDPAAFELSYWETIRTSTDAEDFKLYLQKYPNGQFADLAKNKIKSLEASAAPPKSTSSDTSATERKGPSTTYEGARIEHNVTVNGEKGMRVQASFTVRYGLFVPCMMVAYFYYDDEVNTPLKSGDANYRDQKGNVAVPTNFTPAYDPAAYNDLQLFVPYKALNVKSGRMYALKFYLALYDKEGERFFGKSGWYKFNLTMP
jgi:uncharacterized caspase-like protein